MQKTQTVVGALLWCFVAGGSWACAATVTAQPVTFPHAEEMVAKPGFLVLADRREFAVMAFLNAVGFDEEAKGQPMHPVRVKVRRLISENLAAHPDKVQAWRKYYQGRHLATFHYQDFALSLNTDYPFQRIRPDRELNYARTARELRDFPELLNDFWATAKLAQVWAEVKPDYVAEIRKYDLEKMQRQLASLWQYLRMPRKDTLVLVNVPNLLDAHFEAIGARYENYYYSVESPGAGSYDLNTHEYLHSIVNPLVKSNYARYEAKLRAYYRAGKGKPFSKTYGEPVTLAFESLVRALDHRLAVLSTQDPTARKRGEDRLAEQTDQGLTLAMPFYRLLAEYEQSGKSFDEFMPVLLEKLPNYSD